LKLIRTGMNKNDFTAKSRLRRATETVSAGVAVLALGQAAMAGTYTWNTTAGSWSVQTNWNGGAPAGGPDASGDIVTLSPGANTVTLYNNDGGNAIKTVGSLTLGSSAVINGGANGGSLDFDNGASASILTQTAGSNNINADISINSSKTLNVTNSNGSGNSNRLFLSGLISGTGGITINGPGSTVFSNAGNSFQGGVTLASGTLISNGLSGSFIGTGTLTINGGSISAGGSTAGTWTSNNAMIWNSDFATSLSFSLNTGTGNVTINNGTRTITANGTLTFTVGGVIADGGNGYGMTLAGTAGGRFAFAGANTYTGTTTINSGIQLSIGGGGTTGSLSLSSAIVDNGTLSFNRSDTLTQGTHFNTVISGSGGVAQSGAGTTVLNGANTFTGPVTVTTGTISVATINSVNGGASALGAPTTAANGTISLGGVVNGTGTTGNLTYTGSGNESTDRVINLAGTTGGGSITQNGAGTLTFTSAFTATGLGNKTLTLQGSSGFGEIGNNIVDSTGFKTSLIKTGGNTWSILAGTSFTGTTQITGGILNIASAGTINTTSGITINGGELAYSSATNLSAPITFTAGKLSGTTTVGAVSATNNNDTVAPGSTSAALNFGKLTVAGNLSLASATTGGKLAIELSKASAGGAVGTGGGTYDQVAVTSAATSVDITKGVLVLTAGNNVEMNDVFYIVDNQITSGGLTGTFGSGSINGTNATGSFAQGGVFSAAGYNFMISYNAITDSAFSSTGNDIALQVVPEPTSLSAIGLGLGAMLTRRRRNRAK
jgi:fibronectin-binding autotransporter adhesin